MKNLWQIKDLLLFLHISDVFDQFPEVLVPKTIEQKQSEQLVLGVDLLWKITRIRNEMSWLYNRNGCLDKPDIPAHWIFYRILSIKLHNQEPETLYLGSFSLQDILFWMGRSTEPKNHPLKLWNRWQLSMNSWFVRSEGLVAGCKYPIVGVCCAGQNGQRAASTFPALSLTGQ